MESSALFPSGAFLVFQDLSCCATGPGVRSRPPQWSCDRSTSGRTFNQRPAAQVSAKHPLHQSGRGTKLSSHLLQVRPVCARDTSVHLCIPSYVPTPICCLSSYYFITTSRHVATTTLTPPRPFSLFQSAYIHLGGTLSALQP